jgi:uncharacterized phage protein gp47/JayE
MADYLRVPIAVEPSDVEQEMYADLKARIPNWQENDLNLDTAMLQVTALQVAVVREVASSVLDTIYRTAGASLYGVLPNDATPATGDSTWVMPDAAGYTIPAGTEVSKAVAGDQAIGFRTTLDVVVAPGSSTTAAGGVPLEALVAGAAGTGLSGPLDLVTPLDLHGGTPTITLVGSTIGGQDAEQDAVYLDRYTRRLRRLSFGIVLPADVAEAAQEVAGVDRVLVIDNFIPPSTSGVAAALTVVPIDSAGANVSSGVKTAIVAALAAGREQGFTFSTMDPVRTNIAVTFTATALPGFTTTSVKAAGEAAVAAYLSPANWGQPPGGDQRAWVEDTTVRFGELYAVLNNAAGLDHVTTLTVTPPGTANTNATLTGPGALPNLTSCVGTVT